MATALFLCVAALTAASPAGEARAAEAVSLIAAAARPDARLHDVCFISPDKGWAVGEQGAIWHTDDGGRHWQPQESNVACTLSSVCFVNEQTGWAAGGMAQPYTHSGVGMLLTTRDGGRTWRPMPKLVLPYLRQVRFFDLRRGIAVGCPSALFPSGLLTTDNGGAAWNPVPGSGAADWLAGDFIDLNTGAVAGLSGNVAAVRNGGFELPRQQTTLRGLWRVQLTRPAGGWLVGDGGLVMQTSDLGASWQLPAGRLPDETVRQFDYRALCVRGERVWVGGAPGSQILHSPDGGRTWQTFATGSSVPLDAIAFADDTHGWAVGALGTVLATVDGGRTWRRQRSGGTRAAVLGLFADAEDAPLELLARLAGNDGYLSVVETLARRDVELPAASEVPVADRLRQAVASVGGSDAAAGWRFPLRQRGLTLSIEQIIALWDRTTDGRGLIEAEAHVCRSIRQWRPEIIITHDASTLADDPRARLVNQIVLQAVSSAADPTRFAEQITHAGLEPWPVKKVFAVLPPGSNGSVTLTTAQVAARLGRSLAEVASTPRGLLSEQYQSTPPTLGFRLLLNNLKQDQAQRDFFTGIAISPGNDARRVLFDAAVANLDAYRRAAEKRRNMQAVVDRLDAEPRSAGLLGQAGEMTLGLDEDGAAQILFQLGDRYYRSGRWDAAADTFAMLAERYPNHALARPALVWLVQYYAGSEPAWRMSGARRFGIEQASTASVSPAHFEQRAEKATGFGQQIERMRPELFAEPAVRFPLAVASRNQGFGKQAERFYVLQGRSAESDAWKACAQGELWLNEAKTVSPKPIVTCVVAAGKPKLDGILDDAMWRRAKPAALRSALHDDHDWPAAVMLAYDHEFLYVGIKCRQAPQAQYEPAAGRRPRDPDLTAHDRVEILLDLDRDYATYYRLTVDHRGWAADECWGDRTWDPTWFVAAAAADGSWTAEAAIPLAELAAKPPQSRTVWAVGLQRIVPQAGFQSWTTPAAAAVLPQGFGFLIFE